MLPEDELASHYCLQVPGWCPCVNCRDFLPPSVSLLAKDNAKDDLCDMNRESYRLMLKRENASFTPLIFTTTGGMGDAATQFYKRSANLLSAKHSLSYGIVMGLLRCKLSFSLLRSAIMCIRGARSSLRCPIAEAPIAVQVAEAHM